MLILPTKRSTSLVNCASADVSPPRVASLVALFTVPATTVRFTPLTTGCGVGASVVIVGIMLATPSANASTAFVAASRSRFTLAAARSNRVGFTARPASADSPSRSYATRSSLFARRAADDASLVGASSADVARRFGTRRRCESKNALGGARGSSMATRARSVAREAFFLRHRARAASGARGRGAVWGELSSGEGARRA